MPRYYFDIIENDHRSRDREGVDLPSLDDARREAQEALADMAAEVFRRSENATLTIEIRTESDGASVEVIASASIRTN